MFTHSNSPMTANTNTYYYYYYYLCHLRIAIGRTETLPLVVSFKNKIACDVKNSIQAAASASLFYEKKTRTLTD